MKKACLLSIYLVCSAIYGHGYSFEDHIAVFEVTNGALNRNGEDAMPQSGRHVHNKKLRKQVCSENTALQPAIRNTTLKTRDVNRLNHSDSTISQSATDEITLKVTDVDSLNRSGKTVSQPTIEETTLKVKKDDSLWNRRDNTIPTSTMKVVIEDILDKENFLEHADKVMIRTCLLDAIGKYGSENIEVYERTDITVIEDERSFQQSGLCAELRISETGQLTAVNYILIPEVMRLGDKQILLTTKLINVTTGKIIGGTPVKRCTMEYNNYCVACQQIVETLLNRLVE